MAVEKTRFDDWLKENLWRDLIFRSFIWVSIASLASYFTLAIDAVDANNYFKSQTNSAFRLSRVFGTIAILLGLVAMMFKDMEVLSPNMWGRNTMLGGVGGFFRRLAGDLTLWTLGVLVAVLLAITVYGVIASGATWGDWAIFSFFYLLVAAMCLAVAFLNVYVRRAEPFLSEKLKNPLAVGIGYVAAIVGFPIYTYCTQW
jgi:uncharacterized membrane protein (Fun14 family)